MLAGDRDGSELQRRIKAVRREAHHMHAFLRFRPGDKAQGAPDYLAWHEPAHDVLDLGAEHFVPRMGRHSWLIGTPRGWRISMANGWSTSRPARPGCARPSKATTTRARHCGRPTTAAPSTPPG